jgi:menaquinol-cytochrome c reductase iron-sulfur subunit
MKSTSSDPMEEGARTSTPRRGFLALLSAGLGAIAAALVSVPVVGLLLSPARREDAVWRAVGEVDRFTVGETVLVTYLDPDPLPWAGFAARNAAWLRRDGPASFVAFSPYCTHVGCPVTWSPGAELFLCPCHGGSFHQDGSVAAGPPPRALDLLPVRIRSGQVEVRTTGVPLTG